MRLSQPDLGYFSHKFLCDSHDLRLLCSEVLYCGRVNYVKETPNIVAVTPTSRVFTCPSVRGTVLQRSAMLTKPFYTT